MAPTVVMAFGGNALVREGEDGAHDRQLDRAWSMVVAAGELARRGHRLVLSHGNGPQVGNLAIQQEAAGSVAAQPLFSLVAMTQAQIGHLVALPLAGVLAPLGTPVVVVVTHVLVDPDDPEFANPTKPIGPFLSADDADRLRVDRGWTMARMPSGAYRRVVPSPAPQAILELDSIRSLVFGDTVVVAAGGGGIPVVEGPQGCLVGVDAVIDKDLAAASLATSLGADTLVLLTAVPAVTIDFGTPREKTIDEMNPSTALKHLRAGQFPPGSMGPKVTAATTFLQNGGSLAIITTAEHLVAAIEGEHGTRILPD